MKTKTYHLKGLLHTTGWVENIRVTVDVKGKITEIRSGDHEEGDITIEIIDSDVQVVMDTCLGSFPGADLEMKKTGSFEGNPVWLSIGHSVGAAIGVGLATKDRVLLICGDGGFQTIAQALSTIAKLDMQVLVIIIDNKTYAIEQYLIDGEFFTNPSHPQLEYVVLNDWDYCKVAEGMGFEETYSVHKLDELKIALSGIGIWKRPVLIEVNVPPRDLPAENRSNIP